MLTDFLQIREVTLLHCRAPANENEKEKHHEATTSPFHGRSVLPTRGRRACGLLCVRPFCVCFFVDFLFLMWSEDFCLLEFTHWNLNTNMLVLRDGATRRLLAFNGGALVNEISALRKRVQGACLSFSAV
jgi:hypothetical protein